MRQSVAFRRVVLTALVAALFGFEQLPAAEPLPNGAELAKTVRELVPEKSVEISATVEFVGRERKRHKIPLIIRIERSGQAQWSLTCLAKCDGASDEQWQVYHELGQENRYEHNSRSVHGVEIHTGLAGSSFTIADLGLEFLHWPSQVVLKTQRRKSRLCDVLESRNPKPTKGGYHRVVSWIDKKTGGILLADIYTDKTKPTKQFAVKGLTKKDGQWQVDEMEMRDTQTRARSRLYFHLK